MRWVLCFLFLFLVVAPASADMLNAVVDVDAADSDYTCSVYVATWEQEVYGWLSAVSPVGNIVGDAKEVFIMDNSTYVNLDCRSDSSKKCGFFASTRDGVLASLDVMNCRPKIDKGNLQIMSLMLGGLVGIAFVMAAMWRF